MRVSQLLKPNVVDTTVFNELPPKHKEVVNDFYNQVEKSDGNIIDRVETTIDKVATKHNVNTEILYNYIEKETGDANSIYWSVENNGLGEAALIVINDFGEENIPGLFVSEPIRKGHVRKFRKGFNTTHSTKVTACSRLKTMIENDKMVLHSKPMITELKNYVATGSSYQAKLGSTDDLVSATLLAIRMMDVLKDWDPRIYDTFNQADQQGDYVEPMPIFITNNY